MKFICPLITVGNIERSKEFYTKVLGQKIKYDFGENVTFEGDFVIHLDTHFKDLINYVEITRNSNNFELYFEHNQMDELEKKLKELNVKFVHKIREQPWRQKVMRFYDPDNNMIEVGESLAFLSFRLHKEGKDTNEIANITNMPEVFVKSSITEFS